VIRTPVPHLGRLCSTSTPEHHTRIGRAGRSPALPSYRGGPVCKLALGAEGRIVRLSMALPLSSRNSFSPCSMSLGNRASDVFAPPVFITVPSDGAARQRAGGTAKPLLKDKKDGFWLAVMLESAASTWKKLAALLGAPRFSFGGADDLTELPRGCAPGVSRPLRLSTKFSRPLRHACARRPQCSSTTRSTTTRWRTIARPRLALPICCASIAACGHETRAR